MDAQHDSAAAPLPNAARAHRAPLTLAPSSISADRCLRVQSADACDATARTSGAGESTLTCHTAAKRVEHMAFGIWPMCRRESVQIGTGGAAVGSS